MPATKKDQTVSVVLRFERIDDAPQLFPETFRRIIPAKSDVWFSSRMKPQGSFYASDDYDDSETWTRETIDDCPQPIGHIEDGEFFGYLPGYRFCGVSATLETLAAIENPIINT